PPHAALFPYTTLFRSGVVEIEVEDDGAGVDVEAVGAGTEGDEALLDALCRHGFSTRTQVSDVSGRGVGLDVVKRRVESVGGRVRDRKSTRLNSSHVKS